MADRYTPLGIGGSLAFCRDCGCVVAVAAAVAHDRFHLLFQMIDDDARGVKAGHR
jgi:hypothetical protein